MATMRDLQVTMTVERGVVRSTQRLLPTQAEQEERIARWKVERRAAVHDEYRALDPDQLYVWYFRDPDQRKPCHYCGAVLPYWTATPDFNYDGREPGDMRCAGQWHCPIVSYPCDFLSGLDPVPLATSGFAPEQCANLSALSEAQPPGSVTGSDPE